jgi:hypothetical protein
MHSSSSVSAGAVVIGCHAALETVFSIENDFYKLRNAALI